MGGGGVSNILSAMCHEQLFIYLFTCSSSDAVYLFIYLFIYLHVVDLMPLT